jgi:perosamine synthetase
MRYPVSRPCIGLYERHHVYECLDRVSLSQGEKVRFFEQVLGEYLEARFVVATTSGTTALHLVLAALGLGPGDEVLVPDVTFVATANAVSYTGATPILVDVNTASWCINTGSARNKITKRTRAIIPVHLYGVACEMTEIMSLAEAHGLKVIEDAAEGLTGSFHNKMLGAIGDAGIYSFYGNKIITCGEGGAVSTNDEALYRRMYFLRGQALDPKRRYFHPEVGFNYRMTDVQAALGLGQLTHLRSMLLAREEVFAIYSERLREHGTIQSLPPYSVSAPWVFTLRLPSEVNRDGLMERLAERGIETRPGFVPLHRLPMFNHPDTSYPVASRIADQLISLPTYADLKAEDVHTICDEFERAL